MKIKNQILPYLSMLIISICIFASCNDEIINRLRTDYPDPNETKLTRDNKVLYINIEDLPGLVVKELVDNDKLPQLSSLLRKSIYSYNSIAEAQDRGQFTRQNGLANLMTGVMSSKHGVLNTLTSYNRAGYPSVLERFHQKNSTGKSSFFTSKTENASTFADSKTNVQVSDTDEALENSILAHIAEADDQIIVLNLSSLSQILDANNGNYNAQSYSDKVIEYDNLIGKLRNALESRKNSGNDDWIIMLSSTNGGKQTGTIATLYDDDSRNTFTMVYNAKFSLKYYARPTGNVAYADSAIRFVGASSRGRLADVSKYNFGSYGNYTVQVLINAGTVNANYPSIISKRHQIFDESTGWTLFGAGGNWEFRAANWSFKAGGRIKDGQWHVLTVVFDGTNRQIRLYQDGVLSASGTMNNKDISNNAPLSIGQIGTDYNSNGSEYLLNNIQIYNRSFTDDDVRAVYCQTNITESHPYYNSLIGYWKANEFGRNILKESMGTGDDFMMSGAYVWDTFNEVSPNLCPPVNSSYYRNVLNSVDLPFMMFSWLGIPIERDWNWDGRAMPLPYDVLTK